MGAWIKVTCGAGGQGRLSQRHALLAGGLVAQVTHGVQGFAGAAGRDEHTLAGQRAGGLATARQLAPCECRTGAASGAAGRHAGTRRRPPRARSRNAGGGRLPHSAMAAAKIVSGSGKRPGPVSGPVSRPRQDPGHGRRGSAAWPHWPAWRRAATFPCAWPGQKAPGPGPSTRWWSEGRWRGPPAALANRSAVAGATTIKSASWPIRTWLTWSTASKTSFVTGRPLSASHVATPTNFVDASVGMTVTSWPASVKRRSSKADL